LPVTPTIGLVKLTVNGMVPNTTGYGFQVHP
jgi:hypothetical protein